MKSIKSVKCPYCKRISVALSRNGDIGTHLMEKSKDIIARNVISDLLIEH